MSIFDAIKNSVTKTVEDVNKAAGIEPDASGFWGGKGDDLDKVLAQKAATKGEKLNYQTSIVDLFKTLDLDPSYENRKQLAQEMGKADYSGTAEDNIWLHKATLEKLEANGARVPASMKG